MKKYYTILCLSVLLITSCTKTLYNHQEVLNSYKTKSDVVARFGTPSEVITNEAKTTVYYYYANETSKIAHTRLQPGDPLSKNNKRAFIDELGKPLTLDKPLATNDSYTHYFDKYSKFIFSDNNKVIGSEAKGINLSVRAPDNAKTIVLGVLPPLLLFGLSASSTSFGSGWGNLGRTLIF